MRANTIMAKPLLYSWTKVAPTLGVIFVSPAILTVGCTLGTMLPFWYAIATSIITGVTISLFIYLHGGVGAREHLPFTKLMEASLGASGSRFLASPLITITQIGWYSVGITLGGEAASQLTGINSYVMITAFGVAMALVTYSGFSKLSNFTKVTACLTAAFSVWSLYAVMLQQPSFVSPPYSTEGLLYAAGLAIGGATSISTVSPDFLKDARGSRDVRITSFVIIMPLILFTLISGNIMGAYTSISNPVFALVAIGLPLLANLLLLLGSCAAASSLYPPSLALANITKIQRKYATIFAAIGGLVLAYLGIVDSITYFLRFIGILLPPLIGMNLAEYYLLSKRVLTMRKGTMMAGVLAWLIGALVGFFITLGTPPINALLAGFISYYIFRRVQKRASVRIDSF